MVAKKFSVAAAAAVATMVLAACGGADGGGASDTLTLGAFVPASTQSAADARWANESPYMQAVYDSLVHLSPTGEPEPWLATKWSLNDDKTVMTLTLRTDVKFTDGEPFTAAAAAQNILRFRDGTSPSASNLANVEDAKAIDDATLEITMKQPDPALLVYLGQNAGLMESPRQFDAPDEQTKPVGSGPYVLDSDKTVEGSKYVYAKNPDYWAPDSVYYDKLVITVLADKNTQVNAIKGGQVSGLNVIDQTTNEEIERAGFTLFPHELDWTGLMLMDRAGSLNEAIGKVEVRQAINHAIDRDAMLKAEQGHGTVTSQVFPKTSPGYDTALDEAYPFDPEKAKQLLADAGYPNGFELAMPLLQAGSTTSFDLVKQYLGDVGITVKYSQLDTNAVIEAVVGGKYAASLFQLQMDPTAWQQANFLLLDTATFNPFHQPDATVSKLVSTIQNGDEAEADAATAELNKYVVEQAWFNPWYRVEGNFAADADTVVTQQNDNAYPYLWNIKPKG